MNKIKSMNPPSYHFTPNYIPPQYPHAFIFYIQNLNQLFIVRI